MTDTTAGEGVRYVDGRLDMNHAPSLGRYIAKSLASEVSGNRQPCMSGDNRDRLHEHVRHRFDRTCETVAAEIIEALAAQPSAGAQGEALWAMHIRGPDDLYPAPDYDTAVKWCDYVNYSAAPRSPDVMMAAVPAIWPYAPERHQDGLAGSVADWTLPLKADGTKQVIKPLYATPAQPDTGDVAALREGWVTIPDNTGDMILNGMVGALDCLDEIASAAWSGDDAVERIQAFARREHDYALAALSKPNAPGREG